MRTLILLLLLGLLLPACSVFKSRQMGSASKIQREVAQSPVFTQALTGFTLLDPTNGKTLADYQGNRYFTPASNAKILTLATCLEILGDSVPGMLFKQTDSSLTFRATADPTFLHPKFDAWQQIAKRIQEAPQSELSAEYVHYIPPFGPGWAWDDTDRGFSTERSGFPVFANSSYLYAVRSDSIALRGSNYHKLEKLAYEDRIGNNAFAYFGEQVIRYGRLDTFSADFEAFIPIKNVSNLREEVYSRTWDLLEQGLKRKINAGPPLVPRSEFSMAYSTPIDTVLRRMMYQSDNFIAEQMLLVCAGVKFDQLSQEAMVQWMLDSSLNLLPHRPKWVDGSGLSRYNLMTPQSTAQVLLHLLKTQPKARLFSLFPAGGVNGTLKEWYKGNAGKPYVFAKSGSMSAVQCLSGYLLCKSGKVLIFSFMNNNIPDNSKAWKMEMQRVLEQIRDQF